MAQEVLTHTIAPTLTPHQQMAPEELIAHLPPKHLRVPGQNVLVYIQMTTKDHKYPTPQTNREPVWMPVAVMPDMESAKVFCRRLLASGYDAFDIRLGPMCDWYLLSGILPPAKPDEVEWSNKELKDVFATYSKDLRDSIDDIEARLDAAGFDRAPRVEIPTETKEPIKDEPVKEEPEEPKRKKRVKQSDAPIQFSMGRSTYDAPPPGSIVHRLDHSSIGR